MSGHGPSRGYIIKEVPEVDPLHFTVGRERDRVSDDSSSASLEGQVQTSYRETLTHYPVMLNLLLVFKYDCISGNT